ncbi:MAG: Ribosomal large subunit pseudouridine synthase E [Bacteroidetes bacterium ADurb.Bin141]|nr:MAG: ribosomal large subunit pseudouridine synthase E [Bacteroidetes bacterium OLB10]MCE7955285.1 pseudouridine synthase [Bacteroidetes bacterium CHB6]OQB63555.1 MAG: Ribosomal large subunit pseudouridine synthase E [Bacteroidetes bacterium ADurb.Bin141]
MNLYYVLYKPYGYLSKFTDEGKHKGLLHLINVPKEVYPVGRLDVDSEGLLILTNDNFLKHRLTTPQFRHKRVYAVQVDGQATQVHINLLKQGVQISVEGKAYKTLPPHSVRILEDVHFPERIPPVRFRKNIPTSWIELVLTEGKNRQVRRMTAAVGIPTLRLIRTAIENISITNFAEGELRAMSKSEIYTQLNLSVS